MKDAPHSDIIFCNLLYETPLAYISELLLEALG